MHAPLREPTRVGNGRLRQDVLDEISVESPALAYDLDVVRSRLREFAAAFQGRVGVRYAVKCNPDPCVLRVVAEEGAGFEVASLGELLEVLALGGNAHDTLYSNPVKPPGHIASAYLAGVRRFAVDSVEEVEKVARVAPGAQVYARLRVDDTSSRFPLSSKFGCSHDQAERLLLRSRELGLEPIGLTFHVGSQCTDVDAWAHAVRKCAPVMSSLSRQGIHVTMLDLGGGFPADYGAEPVPSLRAIGARVLTALAELPYLPDEIVCEPGRAVVAEAATLITTVIGRTERNGRHWVFVDVGAYNGLMEAAQTGGRMEFPLSSSRQPGAGTLRGTLTGPSCDSSDTLFQDAELPADIAVGDRLYIGAAGAYSLCYAAPFNGFPIPRPVYL